MIAMVTAFVSVINELIIPFFTVYMDLLSYIATSLLLARTC